MVSLGELERQMIPAYSITRAKLLKDSYYLMYIYRSIGYKFKRKTKIQ